MHVGDLPENELVQILHLRCKIPESYSEVIVNVMKGLLDFV
jgi:midasin (ATPase involved in ribosome maturation)